ncbi:MAG: isoprenylcysteine carboxyl methyltransferase [Pseudomonadota bacterium]
MTSRTGFKRPASAIPASTGLVAIFSIPILHYLWPAMPGVSDRDQTVLFALTVFGLMVASEFAFAKLHRMPGSGLVFKAQNFRDASYIQDFQVKLVGLVASAGLLALFYWSADLYRGDWYSPFFSLLADYWWQILAIVLAVVTSVHFMMRHPRDGMWHLGRVVMTLGHHSTRARGLKVYLLGLLVKGYFLPLMFCYLVYDWTFFQSRSLWEMTSFPQVYEYLFRFSFFLDLTVVVIGYATATRLLMSHIRWTETTVSGWLVCLACYAPFWQVLSRDYFNYTQEGFAWGAWLWDYPVLYTIWGCTILFFLGIYCLTAARMGLRFSNLTYRGLACDFPYNLSKHPSYISKNISWWLVSIPFIAVDFWTGVANCMALLGVNFIYFMRAWHEERCLSQSPSYRAYQQHIRENGLLARIRRVVFSTTQRASEKLN